MAEYDIKEIKEFIKKFENELRTNNFKDIIQKFIDRKDIPYGWNNKFLRFLIEEICGENVLDFMTNIPDRFYADDKEITEVDIPANITSIGSEAFLNCEKLEKVHMSDSVKELLGRSIFRGCKKLSDLTLSKEITIIPAYCFYNCESLNYLYIPDKVYSIGTDAFYNCPSSMKLEMKRGIVRQPDPAHPHPKSLDIKKSTAEFISQHVNWL